MTPRDAAMPKRSQLLLMAAALLTSVAAGVLSYEQAQAVLLFSVCTVALALMAAVVGEGTEQLGARTGPGVTGVLQAALGNLPELFVSIFALRQGLIEVVRFSLIGSILSNSLLVLGAAFVAGGWRRGGSLPFDTTMPRMIASLLMLAVAALVIPTLAGGLHTPAESHAAELSIVCALVLLAVFATTLPAAMRQDEVVRDNASEGDSVPGGDGPAWPRWVSLVVLAMGGLGSAFVSDWFAASLRPAIDMLGISQAFAGLVIVAIAGNAVEHMAGIQLAAKGHGDYAVSVILNSSLQVAVVVIPVVVLASWFVTGTVFTLVFPGLLVAALFLTALLGTVIVFDGAGNTVQGSALLGLYGILAAAFWWG